MNASLTPQPLTPQPLQGGWRASSVALLVGFWGILQLGGLFSPGLLDDVDSVYVEIAREMLVRRDFVTPYVDGIRFFDKPPLMFWMAAGSMHLFGVHDWAARLPLALGVLGLLFAVYWLGIHLFAPVSPPAHPDRGGLYAALATGVSIGPYLYTRFFIPDILVALWMTLAVLLLLVSLERARHGRSTVWPSLGFGAVLALDVLTKGLIGLLFPLGFAVLFLLLQREGGLWRRFHLPLAAASFLALAAPWHILAALRNPAITIPPGLGLPPRAGWAWFYLYNEHVARFLQRRIPHDYGQVPIPLFWFLLLVWLVPWTAFLPLALLRALAGLRGAASRRTAAGRVGADEPAQPFQREAYRALLLWAGLVLGFFTLSARQEYYHLPALPALSLLVGGLLAAAETAAAADRFSCLPRQVLLASQSFLVPCALLLAIICGYLAITAPHPASGAKLASLLNSNPALYNLSLGHIFDLTGSAMGFFRGPLTAVTVGMMILGPGSHLLRWKQRSFAANLTIAGGMTCVLLAAHAGLSRFYPILGSKQLALAINTQRAPGDAVAIDGELTAGSTLLFYSGKPVLLVNGRINGPWFGSFWPDAPPIFLDEGTLHQRWAGPQRFFLLTYHAPERSADLSHVAPVFLVANAGGKAVLSNRPAAPQGAHPAAE